MGTIRVICGHYRSPFCYFLGTPRTSRARSATFASGTVMVLKGTQRYSEVLRGTQGYSRVPSGHAAKSRVRFAATTLSSQRSCTSLDVAESFCVRRHRCTHTHMGVYIDEDICTNGHSTGNYRACSTRYLKVLKWYRSTRSPLYTSARTRRGPAATNFLGICRERKDGLFGL